MKQEGQQPVRIVAFGAGNRMNKYLRYVLDNPSEVELVAVVDPNKLRRRNMALEAGLPETDTFATEAEFFDSSIAADAAIICSPENFHYAQAMDCIERKMHVLLEKPIAQSNEECLEIAAAARRCGVRVGVCHVLRRHPYFVRLRELARTGDLGKIVSINHRVAVGLDRATHSFVRGNLNRSSLGNPILLSKCCHDIDLIHWIVGTKCNRVASFGSLSWFNRQNAPADSSERCINCSRESECPYSAVNLYRERKQWIDNFDVKEGESTVDAIERELAEGRYGRCVFRCDNDVNDRQVVAMEFDGGVTAMLSIDMFTHSDCRETRISLTNGEIIGTGSEIKVIQLRPYVEQTFNFAEQMMQPYHAGADLQIMADFIAAIHNPEQPLLIDVADALESHRIGFSAEN